jgi:DtxR family Mn-dependent transcriptional regulator
MDSERTEEYLESIYKRQKDEAPVSTSILAKDLGVSLPAVTDMLRRLNSKGLIDYTASKGATLKPAGHKIAVSIVRRHRLWERFLTDFLGVHWDKVHDEACRLEHATSSETEERLMSLVGGMETCPHGQPIPDTEGNIKQQEISPLAQFEPGQQVSIETIADETPRLLRHLERIGIKPKTVVSIVKKLPDGSVVMMVKGKEKRVKPEIARLLLSKIFDEVRDKKTYLPLTGLIPGETAVIKSVTGGHSMTGRCLSMGLTPGGTIEMLKNFGRGPVLVKAHESDIALGRNIAEKITVVKK